MEVIVVRIEEKINIFENLRVGINRSGIEWIWEVKEGEESRVVFRFLIFGLYGRDF